MTEKCLVGRLDGSQCGSHIFLKENIITFDKVDEVSKKNLFYRVLNFPDNPVGHICAIHMKKYLLDYSNRQKYCCDPFDCHAKRKGTRLINLGLCESVNEKLNILIPPGQKLCVKCSQQITEMIEKTTKQSIQLAPQPMDLPDQVNNPNVEPFVNSTDTPDILPVIENVSTPKSASSSDSSKKTDNNNPSAESSLGFTTESQEQLAREKGLKRVLDSVDLPMPKKQKLSNERKEKMCQQLAENIYEQSVVIINDTFRTNLNVNEITKLQKDSKALQQIMSNIVKCYEEATTLSKKIQILTLIPQEFNYIDVRKYIDCTRYMLRKANDLRTKYGILAEPPRKKISHYSDELIQSIIDFYRDDQNSRTCANYKDCVTVENWRTKKKEKWPKKFLLYSLKELYYNWAEDNISNFERIPGFSFFAGLRPDDCVLAGGPGTHTVCLCSEHQNFKLKARSISLTLDYRVLLDSCVCSVDDEDCMLGNCSDCPGEVGVREYLETHKLIKETGSIIYNTWEPINISKSGDDVHGGTRVTLLTKIEDVATFYKGFFSDIVKLKKHHYISETQKYCFIYLRDNLDYGEGLMNMDFSENFTFIAQDSVQAFYYNNIQATIHPFVLYYRSNDGMSIECASFCVISDHLKHNASVVNLFQEKVLDEIKRRIPWLSRLIYFSDGAPTQYKNKNNFINICNHREDFDLLIHSYNFFATSHGKGPCDGIGAVVKRIIRRASLTLPSERQILTPYAMFQYLDNHYEETKFIWVSSSECDAREKKLQKRFSTAQTVVNTRQYHYVRPVDKKSAEFKITTLSDDLKISVFAK